MKMDDIRDRDSLEGGNGDGFDGLFNQRTYYMPLKSLATTSTTPSINKKTLTSQLVDCIDL